ncbi:MAG TPA: Uma2 family endonuclease [Longimicrobiales bacterium]|nr:Uma2 family endonuclease [Longimicrobiales bacterium]
MATNPRILTADDVFDLPVPEGIGGYDFVDGELVPIMPASFTHGRLLIEVGYRLRDHVEKAGLTGDVVSDTAFVLGLPRDPERMRSPDVAYISREKTAGTNPHRLVRNVPEFVVEVDLTSGKKPGGKQRVVDYLAAGVSLVWTIDVYSATAMAYRPDGSAHLYHDDDVLDAGDVVPGFRLPLKELFPDAR